MMRNSICYICAYIFSVELRLKLSDDFYANLLIVNDVHF